MTLHDKVTLACVVAQPLREWNRSLSASLHCDRTRQRERVQYHFGSIRLWLSGNQALL